MDQFRLPFIRELTEEFLNGELVFRGSNITLLTNQPLPFGLHTFVVEKGVASLKMSEWGPHETICGNGSILLPTTFYGITSSFSAALRYNLQAYFSKPCEYFNFKVKLTV